MVPPGVEGKVIWAAESGNYNIEKRVIKLLKDQKEYELPLYQMWPVRKPRPVKERKALTVPLITGQRILDTFFPIAKGGTVAIPGGFGYRKNYDSTSACKVV